MTEVLEFLKTISALEVAKLSAIAALMLFLPSLGIGLPRLPMLYRSYRNQRLERKERKREIAELEIEKLRREVEMLRRAQQREEEG